jgi:ATP-dependent Clp protease ATP-binding subunit ClpC
MSEFQTAESVGRLIGEGPAADGETLISMVRKQPFSVLLLDEFEKAHPRIWDLFLQVFDEGRLTDHLGQVADFRHCLIIMTSNLGATAHRSAGLGFAPSADSFTAEQIERAIAQTWRPEFQNRIDKVIVFRPLTRELMRSILKKELDRVLSRRGLKDRGWAVEWEGSALEFLLEKGFSPEMGARPLKRAVDQYLLAPLARTIVERRFPEGDQFVFVRSDGRAIQAEFVDPDSDETWTGANRSGPGTTSAGDAPTLPHMILSPQGSPDEARVLDAALTAVDDRLDNADWAAAKSSIAGRMSEPEFWTDHKRHATLARYALMDRLDAATETARSLAARLQRGTRPRGTGNSSEFSRELIGRLALQLYLVEAGLRDLDENLPVEVAVRVEPALEGAAETAAAHAWCDTLEAMYRSWASRRHMQVSEIAAAAGEPRMLLVSGFGAARALLAEGGLHVLERGDGGNGAAGPARITARVKVVPAPLGDVPAARLRADITKALTALPPVTSVVRRYRSEPSPLVRNASGTWRSGKLDQVLKGDFDLIAADAS